MYETLKLELREGNSCFRVFLLFLLLALRSSLLVPLSKMASGWDKGFPCFVRFPVWFSAPLRPGLSMRATGAERSVLRN
jgi:hypothetical protein